MNICGQSSKSALSMQWRCRARLPHCTFLRCKHKGQLRRGRPGSRRECACRSGRGKVHFDVLVCESS